MPCTRVKLRKRVEFAAALIEAFVGYWDVRLIVVHCMAQAQYNIDEGIFAPVPRCCKVLGVASFGTSLQVTHHACADDDKGHIVHQCVHHIQK